MWSPAKKLSHSYLSKGKSHPTTRVVALLLWWLLVSYHSCIFILPFCADSGSLSPSKSKQFSADLVAVGLGTGPLAPQWAQQRWLWGEGRRGAAVSTPLSGGRLSPSAQAPPWVDLFSMVQFKANNHFVSSGHSFPGEVRMSLWNPVLLRLCWFFCLRLFLALWQFVLRVVKQNVYLKINYSKILINSFFRRESNVFLLHTSSLLWKWAAGTFLITSIFSVAVFTPAHWKSWSFLTGIEKSYKTPGSQVRSLKPNGLLIVVSRCAWTFYVCLKLEKLTFIDFSWNLVPPTWLICRRKTRQMRCGTISENLTRMSLALWNPLITWKFDYKYWAIARQTLPRNQGLFFISFISSLLSRNPVVKFTLDTVLHAIPG